MKVGAKMDNKELQEKLKTFATLLEKERIERLHREGLGCETNIDNAKTSVKSGRKYTKIDVGYSGAYMVVNDTGEIYGIKAYGVIHKGHKYGNLDTINDWYWGEYRGCPRIATNLN